MSDSAVALCPRGYGKTSFRVCEALQFGAMPQYISDEFIFPGGDPDEFMGIFLHAKDMYDLHNQISFFFEESNKYNPQGQINEFYNEWYTYPGLKKQILEWLKHL